MVPSWIHFHCAMTGIPTYNFIYFMFAQNVGVFPCLVFFFFFWVFSRAALKAYGGSQARGLIGTVGAGLHHSHGNVGSLSEDRDRTLKLMVPSRIC